jgi:hypothetical protein
MHECQVLEGISSQTRQRFDIIAFPSDHKRATVSIGNLYILYFIHKRITVQTSRLVLQTYYVLQAFFDKLKFAYSS